MQANNKKIMIIVIVAVAAIAALVGAYLLGRGSSDSGSGKTSTATTAQTASTARTGTIPARTVTVTEPATTDTTPAPAPSGPYATESAAAAHVQSQEGGMQVLDPGTTWQAGSTLHVIHATPEGSASYGGDFYYFFVDGYQVGTESFTSANSSGAVDGATFSVTFNAYLPADPHCCPTGGLKTVQFHWDGGSLVTVGSMAGANLS